MYVFFDIRLFIGDWIYPLEDMKSFTVVFENAQNWNLKSSLTFVDGKKSLNGH